MTLLCFALTILFVDCGYRHTLRHILRMFLLRRLLYIARLLRFRHQPFSPVSSPLDWIFAMTFAA